MSDIFWTITPVMENFSDRVTRPWQGRLMASGGVLYLYKFDRESGKIDFSSDAGAMVRKPDLFLSRQQALAAYQLAIETEMRHLFEEMIWCKQERER